MAAHFFGGDRTNEKLERLRKYPCAYTTIFTSNPRASYFTTIYVDAFAGTGYRGSSSTRGGAILAGRLFPADPDSMSFQEGSARIALQVTPRFNRFLFIERSASARSKRCELNFLTVRMQSELCMVTPMLF